MPVKKLTQDDIRNASHALDCEEAALRAVIAVESRGNGFIADGRPAILFEGHIFFRELIKLGEDPHQYIPEHKNIIYPKWTKAFYGSPSGEWKRLDQAMAIHRQAALRSASWGLFQIMGFNHALAGFGDVEAFVKAMHESEGQQLKAFTAFLQSCGLVAALRNKAWERFARGYNGPGYAANKYDTKLAAAYARLGGKA